MIKKKKKKREPFKKSRLSVTFIAFWKAVSVDSNPTIVSKDNRWCIQIKLLLVAIFPRSTPTIGALKLLLHTTI